MNNRSVVDQVVDTFGLPENPKDDPIDREEVENWMKDKNLDTLGALYTYITDPNYSKRIHPPISFDTYFNFSLNYFERCLKEDISSDDWAHSRYEAGWDLVRWFIALWNDSSVSRNIFKEIKNRLAEIYISADDKLKECLVNATLEHLFEAKDIAKYFQDWKKDPVLSNAYKDAMLWVEKGGDSPLSKSK